MPGYLWTRLIANPWGSIKSEYRCSPGGIGNALAREFHRNGLRVFATARKCQDIADLEDEGIETGSLVVDDDESVKSCYAEIKARLKEKGLDYLVNNA